MVKLTQTIRRQQPTNCFNVFGHFVGLVLKGLSHTVHSKLVSLVRYFTLLNIANVFTNSILVFEIEIDESMSSWYSR